MSGSSRVRDCDFGLGSFSGFKLKPYYNSVWVCRQGQQGDVERIRPPPINSKNRLKSFCKVDYANFRPNIFAAGKRIITGDFGRGGAACMMPSSIKKICSFFIQRIYARIICIVFVTLSNLNKTSNRAVAHTYEMHEN